MIVTEVFYGVKCDRCGRLHDGGDYTYHSDKEYAIESATFSDWLECNNKHYCFNCYEYNEGKDGNIPLPDYPEHVREVKKFLDNIITSYNVECTENDDYFIFSKRLYLREKLDTFEESYIRCLADVVIEYETITKRIHSQHLVIIKIKK